MTELPLSKTEETFLYLGLHTAYWNKVEEAVDKLLICAIGDTAKAHILTQGANAKTRAGYLTTIYKECCANEPWKDVALAALAAFNVLRKNRNVMAHGLAIALSDADGAVDLKVRTLNTSKRLHKRVKIDLERVIQEVDLLIGLRKHLDRLRLHIYHLEAAFIDVQVVLSGERPALPDKFPLPALLQTPESQNYREPLIRRRPRQPE